MRRRRVFALHLLRALAYGGALVDLSGPLANQAEARIPRPCPPTKDPETHDRIRTTSSTKPAR